MFVPYTENEIKTWPLMQAVQYAVRSAADPDSSYCWKTWTPANEPPPGAQTNEVEEMTQPPPCGVC
jgi:hypothetical protein